MPYGDLTNKLEAAALAHLASNPVSGVAGYAGQSSFEREPPSVTFIAQRGEETPQASGNYNIEFTCRVESSSVASTLTQHRGYFSGIVDLFTDSGIAAALTAALSDFTVIGVRNPRYEERVENRTYISELTQDAYCCASDF